MSPPYIRPHSGKKTGPKSGPKTRSRPPREETALPTLILRALTAVLDLEKPADTRLSAFFREHPELGRQDRGIVAETAYGVLRHLRSLEYIAGSRAPRPLWLAWLARHSGRNRRELAGLVSEKEIDQIIAWKGADLAAASPAVQLDLPDWLYERLAAQYDERLPALAAALNRPAPLDLRTNTLKIGRDALLAALGEEGIACAATPLSPLGIRLAGKPGLARHPRFLAGEFEVQDEGSQLLALLTGPKRGEMVCDFCAGAGGKTLALGALMKNSGRLYAFDVHEKRLANLKPRLARSGLSNVHPERIQESGDGHLKRLAGKLDRVLVDAPCSGLGTLRRNPDLKWRQSPASIAELTARQRTILAAAARLVKPGGRLVYATCSLLDAENRDIVADFLASHPGFDLQPAAALLARQGISLDTGKIAGEITGEFLELAPDRGGSDGFFGAVLERRA